jgi:hypothetical protein
LIATTLAGLVTALEIGAHTHEAIALFKEDVWPLIEALLQNWPI